MTDAADVGTKVAAIVFVTTSMLSAGVVVSPREIAGRLRQPRLVAPALLVNFVAAPLIAIGLCKVIPVHTGYATGLLLLSGAAGAPFLPKLAQHARASETLAVALMMLLLAGTLLFLPLAMPSLIPGLEARPLEIATPLLLLIAVPLAGGMVWRALNPSAAGRAEHWLRRISDVSLLVFIVVVVATHLSALRGALGSGAILTAMLFVAILGAIGYAAGGRDPGTPGGVMALGAGQRNVAAAIITAGTTFSEEPRVIVMILVTDVVAIALLFAAVSRFRKTAATDVAAKPPAKPPQPARGEAGG